LAILPKQAIINHKMLKCMVWGVFFFKIGGYRRLKKYPDSPNFGGNLVASHTDCKKTSFPTNQKTTDPVALAV